MTLPCPSCEWRETLTEFGGYISLKEDGDYPKSMIMLYKVRCTKCLWEGSVEFMTKVFQKKPAR